MKVLVIEDNPRLADRIKNLLQRYYLIELASSGDEAISIATAQTTDIFF